MDERTTISHYFPYALLKTCASCVKTLKIYGCWQWCHLAFVVCVCARLLPAAVCALCTVHRHRCVEKCVCVCLRADTHAHACQGKQTEHLNSTINVCGSFVCLQFTSCAHIQHVTDTISDHRNELTRRLSVCFCSHLLSSHSPHTFAHITCLSVYFTFFSHIYFHIFKRKSKHSTHTRRTKRAHE